MVFLCTIVNYMIYVQLQISCTLPLRPKAHILDDPLGNPNDGLKVLLGPPYGPYKGPLRSYKPIPKTSPSSPEELIQYLQ